MALPDDLYAVYADLVGRIPYAEVGRHMFAPFRPCWTTKHAVKGRRYVAWSGPCGRWSCRRCGLDHVSDRLFETVNLWLGWCPVWEPNWDGRLWVAERLEYEPRLPSRLRQRRLRRGAEYLWVKRDDGSMFLFSTRDLSGRLTPTTGRWLTVDEALDTLTTVAFRLPGVAGDGSGFGLSQGWRCLADRSPADPVADRLSHPAEPTPADGNDTDVEGEGDGNGTGTGGDSDGRRLDLIYTSASKLKRETVWRAAVATIEARFDVEVSNDDRFNFRIPDGLPILECQEIIRDTITELNTDRKVWECHGWS